MEKEDIRESSHVDRRVGQLPARVKIVNMCPAFLERCRHDLVDVMRTGYKAFFVMNERDSYAVSRLGSAIAVHVR